MKIKWLWILSIFLVILAMTIPIYVLTSKLNSIDQELEVYKGMYFQKPKEIIVEKTVFIEKSSEIVYQDVIKEVQVITFQPFESGMQFAEKMREYSKGITVLSNNQCVVISQILVEQARLEGYDAETEIIDSENHCVVKAIFPDKEQIWLYDHVDGKCWLWRGRS